MRLGYRHWLHPTLRALALATAALALTASAAAGATDRYAVATGGVTSGGCGSGSACALKYAIETAAAPGDTVYVADGTYDVSAPIRAGNSVQVRGQGSSLPRLVGRAGLTGPTLTVDTGAAIYNLRIESASPYVALDLDGQGDTLEIYSSAAGAATVRAGSTLNTALVYSSAASATALTIPGGLLGATTVRHATIVATGAGSTGLRASGVLSSPTVASSIVQGAANDVDGDALNPVNLSYAVFRTTLSSNALGGGTSVDAAPVFADAVAGVFEQDDTSPTVNAGNNSDNRLYDLAGRARTIDGATDVGAYELPIVPAATTGSAGTITGASARISGTVDPHTSPTVYRVLYGTSSPPATATDPASAGSGTGVVPVSADLTGLAPGTLYYVQVVASNEAGDTYGAISSFTTATIAPVSSANAASAVGATSATLNGQVDPGGALTNARFQWGETTAYGNATPQQSVTGSVGQALTAETLSGLTPGTTYHYRVTATNLNGTSVSADRTFTTAALAPTATAAAATGVGQTGATLTGTVAPGGAATTWRFDYGVGDYATTVAGSSVTGVAPEVVTRTLSGLTPGTTYSYRLVAQNSAGSSTSTGTFTTLAGNPPAVPPTPATPPAGDAAPADAGTPEEAPAPDTGDGVDAPVDDGSGAREPRPGETQADGLPAPDPTPPAGQAATAAPSSGTVRVRVPGANAYVTLSEGASIPVGSVVDATRGQVTITSAADTHGGAQTANFGGSEFKVLQRRTAKPITDIVLTGGNFSDCFAKSLNRTSAADVFATRKWSRRRLWGNGKGRFRTRGRHSTATVRGTYWLTEDRCDGTLVRVKRGLVEVRDLVRRKTVMVPAGEQYLSRAPRSSKTRRKR